MNGEEFSNALLDLATELLALSESPRLIAELAAPKIQALIEQDIAQGLDPQGQPWKPLKASDRTPFSNPRRARDAMTPKVDAVGTFVRGRISGWANVHQNSKRPSLPRRMMVPRGGLTLAWERAMRDAAEEAAKQLAPKLAEQGGLRST